MSMSKGFLFCALAGLALSLSLPSFDAQAKRLGGARPLGMQRNATPPPARQPAQAEQPAAPAKAAPAAAPGAAAKWGPLLGGLALGGLLGALFAGNGLGGLALILLLAAGVFLLVKALARGARQPAAAPLAYAALGSETVAAPPPSQAIGLEALPAPAQSLVPAGFDAPGFLRAAKLNFIRLQLANERGDLEELREFTTPEMYEQLRADVRSRAGSQHTDVVTLQADLLELTSEQDGHWACVRFSGLMREHAAATPAGFQEIWNLAKPADGSTGWLLAGIQQMH